MIVLYQDFQGRSLSPREGASGWGWWSGKAEIGVLMREWYLNIEWGDARHLSG